MKKTYGRDTDNLLAKVRPPNSTGGSKKTGSSTLKPQDISLKAKTKSTKARNKVKKAKRAVIAAENKALKAKEVAAATEALAKGKTTVMTEDVIKELPKSHQEAIANASNPNILFKPNPGPQTDFLSASEDQVFYGGARGGGKSYALIADPVRYFGIHDFSGLLLRRTLKELRDLINHSKQLYPKVYPGAKYHQQDKMWTFPSGARFEFGYCENEDDWLQYQGREYHWIGIDELPQFTDGSIIENLGGSLRASEDQKARGIPEVMRFTGNPGNIGSGWVKEKFIDPAPWGEAFTVKGDPVINPKTGEMIDESISRRFVPSTVFDNPHLANNTKYIASLASMGEVKRKQWLEGDWDTFDNSSFPEFSRATHVVAPFAIPNSWTKFRCMDWGYSSPGCCLWIAVDNDDNLIVYRELYAKGMLADEWADQIRLEESMEYISYGVLDSSVWSKRGDVGPTPVETMMKAGVRWRPADRSSGSRVAGKQEIHKRLMVHPDGTGGERPGIIIFNNCVDLIRTFPKLPIDRNNPEDVDTKAEDHAYDALRYGCASRPKKAVMTDGWGETAYRRVQSTPKVASKTFGY